jgi:UDP-glucose 4-epimerase
VSVRGIMPMVDVRDVADLLAAVVRPGAGPRRLPIGGEVLTFDEVLDAAARVLPLPPSFSYEAAWLLTQGQHVDDADARKMLGRPWRDVRTALRESVDDASLPTSPR